MIKQQVPCQLVLTLSVFLFSISTFAAAPDFYTIEDSPNPAIGNALTEIKPANFNPVEALESAAEHLTGQMQELVSLLKWDHHKSSLQDPSDPYNRLKHYGTWLVDRSRGCLDTRGQVLARQSQVPVQFNPQGCRVATGRWLDPYTNQVFTQANDLDVDHVVPLKNSYDSGAWRWKPAYRCQYANYLANGYHLIAVQNSANRQKGQNGPDEYMPPNRAFSCDYLAIWLKIKLIWNLAMSPNEAQSIVNLMKQNRCDPARMNMDFAELQSQRRTIAAGTSLCSGF